MVELDAEGFDAASVHPYECRCDSCLTWWARVGPDPDFDGQGYGPFTEAEVEVRKTSLRIKEKGKDRAD